MHSGSLAHDRRMTVFSLLVRTAVEGVALDSFIVRPCRAVSKRHLHNSNRHQHHRRFVGASFGCQLMCGTNPAQAFRRSDAGFASGAMLTFAVAVSQRTGSVESLQAVGDEMRQPYSIDWTGLAA